MRALFPCLFSFIKFCVGQDHLAKHVFGSFRGHHGDGQVVARTVENTKTRTRRHSLGVAPLRMSPSMKKCLPRAWVGPRALDSRIVHCSLISHAAVSAYALLVPVLSVLAYRAAS